MVQVRAPTCHMYFLNYTKVSFGHKMNQTNQSGISHFSSDPGVLFKQHELFT